MWESYVQAYSNPCRSASFISSIIRWYGGSGRTVTPKLSIDPPRSLAGERAYRRENGSHSGVAVPSLRVRRRGRVADAIRRQRAARSVAGQPGARRVRVVPARHDHPPGGCCTRLQALAFAEPSLPCHEVRL